MCLGERDSAGSCQGVDEGATKGTAFEWPASLVLDKVLFWASTALGGAIMGDSEGLYLEEADESCFTESRDLYLEEPEPELALITAGEEPAECDNGFGGMCSYGLGPKGLGPKGLVFEGSAPKDDALECRDPEDATREAATLAAVDLGGSSLDGPSIGGLPCKTDALDGSGLDGPPIGGLSSKTDAL